MIKFSKEVKKVIKTATNIAVFTHITPDCDALGSSLALREGLSSLGKNITCFTKDKLTKNQTLIFNNPKFDNSDCDFSKYDLCISVDASSYTILGEYGEGFKNHNNTLSLDHHRNNQLKSKLNYALPEQSSCCEIVLHLLNYLKIRITKNIASMLYSGLSADTNSFINSNVTLQTFKNATKLVELGADIDNINELQYKNRTKVEVACKRYLWSNVNYSDDVAYCCVSYEDLIKMDARKVDCDSFSNDLLGIDGVNYSFSLIEENKGKINLSIRAKKGYNVQTIASSLGGGGHICASGAKILNKSLEQAKLLVLNLIEEIEKTGELYERNNFSK